MSRGDSLYTTVGLDALTPPYVHNLYELLHLARKSFTAWSEDGDRNDPYRIPFRTNLTRVRPAS